MRNQELNLLHVFGTIMTEGSISRAADRLGLTQPAVSTAVSRMRVVWSDPVFVRRGRQIEPTSYALSLWDQIRDPLYQLTSALDTAKFEPVTARRTFRVAVTDLILELIWPSLVCELKRCAPGVDLHAVPFAPNTVVQNLREANVDLAVGLFQEHEPSLRSIWLFDTGYVLAMRANHPLSFQDVDLQRFVSAEHLMASMSGDSNGVVDQALRQQGLERRVAVTVNHFSAMHELLSRSDLIATVPEMVTSDCRFCSGMVFRELPVEIEPTSLYLAWHTRHDRDSGIVWMRNQIERVAKHQWAAAMEARGRDCQAQAAG